MFGSAEPQNQMFARTLSKSVTVHIGKGRRRRILHDWAASHLDLLRAADFLYVMMFVARHTNWTLQA